jgi:hypothetical protein
VRARVWAWRVGHRFVCVRYMTMQGRGRLLLLHPDLMGGDADEDQRTNATNVAHENI